MQSFTRDRYPELLAYRNEGLRKVGAMFTDQIEKPKSRCFFPKVWHASVQTLYPSVGIGPLRIAGVGPSVILADEAIGAREHVKVLDIGCAAGRFRDYLQLSRPSRRLEYVGMDIAPPQVDFPVYPSMDAVSGRDFDFILMSEVAEHMPADDFVNEYVSRFPGLLKPGGMAMVSVPNPLAPGSLPRDVTHVQHYPWYDLYAIMRFFFDEVDVVRTHFIHGPRRLLTLPLLRVLSYCLEFDWCEGIVVIARGPRAELN